MASVTSATLTLTIQNGTTVNDVFYVVYAHGVLTHTVALQPGETTAIRLTIRGATSSDSLRRIIFVRQEITLPGTNSGQLGFANGLARTATSPLNPGTTVGYFEVTVEQRDNRRGNWRVVAHIPSQPFASTLVETFRLGFSLPVTRVFTLLPRFQPRQDLGTLDISPRHNLGTLNVGAAPAPVRQFMGTLDIAQRQRLGTLNIAGRNNLGTLNIHTQRLLGTLNIAQRNNLGTLTLDAALAHPDAAAHRGHCLLYTSPSPRD